MPRARVCLQCGEDFGTAPPWREPRYGLLVCQCPGCQAIAPAPNWPKPGRRVIAWFSAFRRLGITLALVGLCIGVTSWHESLLHDYTLDTESWLLGKPHAPAFPIPSYFSIVPDRFVNGFSLGLRIAAGLLAGVWCLVLPTRRRFVASLGGMFLIAATLGVMSCIADRGEHVFSNRRPYPIGTSILDAASLAIGYALTFACGLPMLLFRGRAVEWSRGLFARRQARRRRTIRLRRQT